jgi:hypothetical protein
MTKAMAKRWVAALRSGKYKQGKNALCSTEPDGMDPTFCCLGVLLDTEWDGYWVPAVGCVLDGRLCWAIDGLAILVIPHTAQSMLGISGGGEFDNALRPLAYYNDTGASFEQIADLIEKNYRKLLCPRPRRSSRG